MSAKLVPAETGEGELFLHEPAAGVVVDPIRVLERVGDLNRAVRPDAAEDGVLQANSWRSIEWPR